MKRFLLALFIVVGSLGLKAQWVSIPDTNFGTWLNTNGYSTCLQGNNAVGWQMDTNCSAVVSATQVNCGNVHIASLEGIQYFDNLSELFCGINQLTTMPVLPESLTVLRCGQNQLTSLPALPGSLSELYCYSNALTSLPPLPGSLIRLECYNNALTTLPSLPGNLPELYCFLNQLTSLPPLPGEFNFVEVRL